MLSKSIHDSKRQGNQKPEAYTSKKYSLNKPVNNIFIHH